MPKFTVVAESITANPSTFPLNKLKKVRKNIKNYMVREAGPMLVDDLGKTVAGWRGKPTFIYKYSEPYGSRQQLDVYPTGRHTLKWKRISEGTRTRSIYPRRAPALRFQRGYTPRTRPGGRYGGPGRRHGPEVVTLAVHGHRIEPRKFSLEVIKRRRQKVHSDLQQTVRKTGGI